MALPDTMGACWLAHWIDTENQERRFIPLGSIALGIEETTISEEMFLVVVCQRARAGRLVGEFGGKIRLAHVPSMVFDDLAARNCVNYMAKLGQPESGASEIKSRLLVS